MSQSDNAEHNYFGFEPILGLEAAALAIFSILTFTILVLNVRGKTHYMTPIVVGGALEIMALAFRIVTTYESHEIFYILYIVPVLVAPTVLAAADYALASIIMNRGGLKIPFFSVEVTKYLFLAFDIAAFSLQGVGGGLIGAAKTPSQQKIGATIILAGFALNLAIFFMFSILAIAIHVKVHRNLQILRNPNPNIRWTRIFYVIYANIACLVIRAVYRVVEFQDGNMRDDLSTNEGFFYGLDVLLMVLLMIVWIPFHPSFLGMSKDKSQEEHFSATPMSKKVADPTARPNLYLV